MLRGEPFPRLAKLLGEHFERGNPAGRLERGVVVGAVRRESEVVPGAPEIAGVPGLELTEALSGLQRRLTPFCGSRCALSAFAASAAASAASR